MIAGVPYDAEVEYLESTGTQYFLLPTSQSVKIAFECEAAYSRAGGYDLFGFKIDSLLFQLLPNYTASLGTILDIPKATNSFERISTASAPSANVFHKWRYINYIFSIDDNTVGSYYNYEVNFPPYVGVFCRYNGESAINSFAHAKIASLKFYNGTALMANLIPVRVGQVGYMFDRVTRKLFGNQGTGSFIVGPDVAKTVMGLHFFKNN